MSPSHASSASPEVLGTHIREKVIKILIKAKTCHGNLNVPVFYQEPNNLC